MVFLVALTINNLNLLKEYFGLKVKCKNKTELINYIGKHYYTLNNNQQLNILNKLNISYNEPKIISENFSKCKIIDLKYTLFLKNINYLNKNRSDLIKSIKLIDYYYSLPIQNIIRLQNIFKYFNIKKKILTQGISLFNRSLCNNEVEFMTYTNLKDIEDIFYTSYRDIDGFYYGFDIRSLNHMIKNNIELVNPYNRNKFTIKFINNINRQLKNLNDKNKILEFEQDDDLKTPEQLVNDEIMSICKKIDELGYYSILEWFNTLSINQFKRFHEYLVDIWQYRLQLPISQKIKIVPPHGNPFIKSTAQINSYNCINMVRKSIFSSINIMMNSAENIEDQKLGCMYVLMALTLVNNIAAQDLPWLYQSAILV